MPILTPTQEAQIRATIAEAVEFSIKNLPTSDQTNSRDAITKTVIETIGLQDTDNPEAFKG